MDPGLEREGIVRKLEEMADILEIPDADPLELVACRNGVQLLDEWEGDLEQVGREGSLTAVDGTGKGLSAKIADLIRRVGEANVSGASAYGRDEVG